MSMLKKRARAAGLAEEQLEEAEDSEDPRGELTRLTVELSVEWVEPLSSLLGFEAAAPSSGDEGAPEQPAPSLPPPPPPPAAAAAAAAADASGVGVLDEPLSLAAAAASASAVHDGDASAVPTTGGDPAAAAPPSSVPSPSQQQAQLGTLKRSELIRYLPPACLLPLPAGHVA
jgi:hypothetical protein